MGWLYELEEGKEVQWVEEVLPGLPAQNNVSATVQTCGGTARVNTVFLLIIHKANKLIATFELLMKQ